MASMTRWLPLMLLTLIVAACSSGRKENGEQGADTSSASRASTASLENTYWRLVMIGEKPVATAEGRREAQMTLSSEGKTVKGFSGCNGFSGPYTLDGSSLKFGSVISTKMACVDGMDVENGFFSALSATASYTITGERLQLLDAKGTPLARFESVYLR